MPNDLDYCWKCHTYSFVPGRRDCASCGQVNAYSVAHLQLVQGLIRQYPGFHTDFIDAAGTYRQRYCPETGERLAR